jgi:hypothetical protein
VELSFESGRMATRALITVLSIQEYENSISVLGLEKLNGRLARASDRWIWRKRLQVSLHYSKKGVLREMLKLRKEKRERTEFAIPIYHEAKFHD